MDRHDPTDCREKFNYLLMAKLPRMVLGHNGNLSEFADKLGMSRTTLRDQRDKCVLSGETQKIMAAKLKFDLNWPSWTTGTSAEFEACYREAHEAAKVVEVPAVLLRKGQHRAPVKTPIEGLASVELFPAQIAWGTADIGFEISCGVATLNGIPVTIRTAGVTWIVSEGAQLDRATRKGYGADAYTPDGRKVRFKWNGADTSRPSWRIEADGQSIGDLDIPADFGRLVGLKPGSTLTIVLGVWRSAIAEAEGVDTTTFVSPSNNISIPVDGGEGIDPKLLPEVKRRVLALVALEALETRGDFIVLAKHTVTFEKKDTDAVAAKP